MNLGKNKLKFCKNRFSISFYVLILLSFVFSISAKTLEEYKANVKQVKNKFGSISSESKDFETELNKVFEQSIELLPPKDKIETDGKTIDINNQWLTEKIKEYKNESEDSAKQELILAEIYEILEAIEIKINELETVTAKKRSKDENKQKLNEILKREEYKKPEKKEESLFAKLYRLFWNG